MTQLPYVHMCGFHVYMTANTLEIKGTTMTTWKETNSKMTLKTIDTTYAVNIKL